MSSNLVRIARFCGSPQPPAFLRELFESIGLSALSQAESDVTNSIPSKASRSAKYQRTTSKNARADRARGRFSSGSCNGLFSPGNSLQGSGALPEPHPIQRTGLPFPSRAGPAGPQGSSTAHFQLSKSSTATHTLQTLCSRGCNFSRVSAERLQRNPARLWKAAVSVGNHCMERTRLVP